MRTLIFFLFSLISSFSYSSIAQPSEDWFIYKEADQTYTIDSKNIKPQILLHKLAEQSGIEILYDASLKDAIDIFVRNADIYRIVGDLQRNYSTMTKFRRNRKGEDILVKLTILPKDQYHSNNLIQAMQPLQEAISLRSGNMPDSAKSAYLTRLDHLEKKIRDTLTRQAEKIISKREQRNERRKTLADKRDEKRKKAFLELEALKDSDPELYEREKSILESLYGKEISDHVSSH